MALTEEQRSLLQLLLQGQSYADIGSLLGEDPADVRARARAALEEIGGADPDARVQMADFLLGQADPIGRADAVRQLQNDPDANGLAQSLVAQLRLLAPRAQLPEVPPLRGGRTAQPAPPPAPAPGGPGAAPPSPGPSKDGEGLASRIGSKLGGLGGGSPQSRTMIGLGLAGVLVIAVVLALVLGGGDDGGGGEGGGETTTQAAANEGLIVVELGPLQEGSEASGQATFAQAQGQPLIQLNLFGLQPAPEGETYIVWLFNSDRAAFPLARDQVDQNGNLTGAAAIPQELVSVLGQFGCIDVSLASNAETQRALQQAVDGRTLPRHSGESVLRGQIPAAPGETAPSGAEAQCNLAAAQQPGQSGQSGQPGGSDQ